MNNEFDNLINLLDIDEKDKGLTKALLMFLFFNSTLVVK